MKRVAFSTRYTDEAVHPFTAGLRAAGLDRAELLTWSPTAEPTTLSWVDGDPAAAERLVATVDSVTVSETVAGDEGTYLFLRQRNYEFPAAAMDVIAAARVGFPPPVVFHADGRVTFEAVGESAAVSRLHDDLRDLAAVERVRIERVQPFARTERPERLTPRQEAALETAVDVGYYEVPREGSVADVAAALECATSTAGELLRKAETAVVRAYVEDA